MFMRPGGLLLFQKKVIRERKESKRREIPKTFPIRLLFGNEFRSVRDFIASPLTRQTSVFID